MNDEKLGRLSVPVMAILGGKNVMSGFRGNEAPFGRAVPVTRNLDISCPDERR
jgi:hypothetical protein